jgi:hypothetical protein
MMNKLVEKYQYTEEEKESLNFTIPSDEEIDRFVDNMSAEFMNVQPNVYSGAGGEGECFCSTAIDTGSCKGGTL